MARKPKDLSQVSFRPTSKGLFVKEPGKKKRRLCPYIHVSATGTYEGEDVHHIVIRFEDRDGKRKRLVQPQRDLLRPRLILERLADENFGLPKTAENRKILTHYFSEAEPKGRALLTRRTGWHGPAFVTRRKTFGHTRLKIIRCHSNLDRFGVFQTSGSLKEWKLHVAKPARASSRLMFVIGVAFAAPLLEPSGTESGIFHLVGASSKGKSTALLIAQSVFGRAIRERLTTWDTTDTALEEIAQAHFDIALCLDEIARLADTELLAARRARKIAYMLTGGQGKLRSTRFSKHNYMHADWRTLVLSSGETGLSETSAVAGLDRMGGEMARFIDLPAEVNEHWGIFERLPKGHKSSAIAAETIEEACKSSYGIAGRRFIEALVGDYDGAKRRAKELIGEFLADFHDTNSGGWELRFAKRFALVYAAMVMAREFKIVPWKPNEIRRAVRSCYLDARAATFETDQIITKGLERLRKRLKNPSRVVQIRPGKKTRKKDCNRASSYLVTRNRESFFAVKTEKFRKLMGDRLRATLVLRTLQRDGLLITHKSSAKFSKPVEIKGLGRRRYYCISKSFLEDVEA